MMMDYSWMSNAHLTSLGNKKKKLLSKEEVEWRVKNRATWLDEGDNNTIFSHNYANFKKNVNTIWEIDLPNGLMVKYFKDISSASKNHLQALFKDPDNANIPKLLRSINYFLGLNVELDVESTKEELKEVFTSFKKAKNPRPQWLDY
jgi:hypothetical protein